MNEKGEIGMYRLLAKYVLIKYILDLFIASKKIDVKREKMFPFSLQWLEFTTIELFPVVAAWYGNILVPYTYFYLTIAIS